MAVVVVVVMGEVRGWMARTNSNTDAIAYAREVAQRLLSVVAAVADDDGLHL